MQSDMVTATHEIDRYKHQGAMTNEDNGQGHASRLSNGEIEAETGIETETEIEVVIEDKQEAVILVVGGTKEIGTGGTTRV